MLQSNEIQKIYPQAQKKNAPSLQSQILSLPFEDGYLWLDKETLSPQEIALLKLMYLKPEKQALIQEHPWYPILFQQATVEKDGVYRVIQIHLETKPDFLLKEWRENIEKMFPKMVDFFFLSKDEVILVEGNSKEALTTEELAGIFTVLDADFDSVTKAFIGDFNHSDDMFYQLFQAEREVFKEELPLIKSKRTFKLADVALHYFTKDSMRKSPLIHNYRRHLDIDNEMSEIIETLWRNQGNISSTAKELFMHRNTLQYRLERFQELTGLNVKNTDELILCYLLLL